MRRNQLLDEDDLSGGYSAPPVSPLGSHPKYCARENSGTQAPRRGFLALASSDSAPYRRGFRVRIARGQQELHLVSLQCSSRPRPGRPPPKTPFGKPLLCNPEPLAVISQDFDRGRIPGAEHEQAPREWVFLQLLPA